MNKITIVGGGNGGLTAAYHFSKMGNSVCIYDTSVFDKQIKAIKQSGGIRALEELNGLPLKYPGFEEITKATNNPKEAAEFSDIIFMICPSFAQEPLFLQILPYLKNGQTIVLMPGNYGGLVLNNLKNSLGKKDLELNFVDCISIPWACRIHGSATVCIMGEKQFLPMSVFPSKSAKTLLPILSEIFPIPIELLHDPICAGLENINFGGHPLMTTLSIGLLENFDGDFTYYKDCCSPATAKVAAKMDCERTLVGKAYRIGLRTELEAMNSLYDTDCKSVYEFNRASSTHGKIKNAPNSSKSRYITEDVPYLLVPCYCLAKLAGLRVPIVESIISLTSAMNDENYFESGRTLEKMGLKGIKYKDLLYLIEEM